MATSKARKTHELQARQHELRQRAAWAKGEERQRLMNELEAVSAQIEAAKARGR